ncbi:MAG: hypothetical protein IKG85_01815 [Clostridia bacterium]|nr:hypothetical protein [Clostridia bacterium]
MNRKLGWAAAVIAVIALCPAADKLIEAFRQSSVLIQTNVTTTEFYNGK